MILQAVIFAGLVVAVAVVPLCAYRLAGRPMTRTFRGRPIWERWVFGLSVLLLLICLAAWAWVVLSLIWGLAGLILGAL